MRGFSSGRIAWPGQGHTRYITHFRRRELLLDWAERECGSAPAIWRSNELGAWNEVRISLRIRGQHQILRFQAQQGPIERRISSVKPTREGLRIVLEGESGCPHEALDLVCRKSGPANSQPSDLFPICHSWLRQRIQGARVERAQHRPDLAHSLSGAFLRILARHSRGDYLLLSAAADQDEEKIPSILTQALIWLHLLRKSGSLHGNSSIVLIVPAGRSAVLNHRARCLDPASVSVEVWEYLTDSVGLKFRPAPLPQVPEEHRDFRWPVLGPFRWSRAFAEVMELAPDEIRRYPRYKDYDSVRLRGLEFARVEGGDRSRVTFGVGSVRTELTTDNFDGLRRLVEEILYYRRADTPDERHPFFRLQSERWLESMILEDVARLFPELAPGAIYSQIPVYLGNAQGRVDILGVDNEGTLVVMELKVAEDPELPMQSLDYWGRVLWHNVLGDFQKRGYFSEARLNREWPRIYLVSPVFSFHDTTERILSFIDSRIDIWKIGINTDWRCGVRVLNRTQIARVSLG